MVVRRPPRGAFGRSVGFAKVSRRPSDRRRYGRRSHIRVPIRSRADPPCYRSELYVSRRDAMRGVSRKPKVDFKPLRARLERLERRYNPDQQNLHFEVLPAADGGSAYPALVDLAMRSVRRRPALALFLHGELAVRRWDVLVLTCSFWISAASGRVAADKAQSYIPAKFVDDLLLILVRIGQFSTVNGGDITKRNHEALGNTLLRFYEKRRVSPPARNSQ